MVGRDSNSAAPAARQATGQQFAALPYRLTPKGAVEVLLLTSRETRRWVIPKGWPIAGLSAAETAVREAYEEAGLLGTLLSDDPIGSYRYEKKLPKGAASLLDVDVFLFKVTRQVKKWPEKAERKTVWTTAVEAANLVVEPALARLLRAAPEHVRQLELAAFRALPKAV